MVLILATRKYFNNGGKRGKSIYFFTQVMQTSACFRGKLKNSADRVDSRIRFKRRLRVMSSWYMFKNQGLSCSRWETLGTRLSLLSLTSSTWSGQILLVLSIDISCGNAWYSLVIAFINFIPNKGNTHCDPKQTTIISGQLYYDRFCETPFELRLVMNSFRKRPLPSPIGTTFAINQLEFSFVFKL